MAFLFIAVTLDMDIAILGIQNLSFGRPGHFGSLGTPWGTMGASGRTRGVQNQIFSDLGMIVGHHF